MAAIKEYAYFIRGSKFAIIQKDFTTSQDGQTLTAPDIDLPSGGGIWKSPLEDITDGIQIEYAYSPAGGLKDEGDDIDLEPYLSKALVYYVKARLFEDAGDMDRKSYMMKEFSKMVEKHNNAKIWGSRRIMSGPNAIR
tara:strand:+ start:564 stop:977 length:414 start_codon:yes stop_codon:yes gene_type:complete